MIIVSDEIVEPALAGWHPTITAKMVLDAVAAWNAAFTPNCKFNSRITDICRMCAALEAVAPLLASNDLHQHLLALLGAKDHADAARIIAQHHARELAEKDGAHGAKTNRKLRASVERLLDEAFHQLQHDTGEHNHEHVWQRDQLRKAFIKTLRGAKGKDDE